MKFFCQFLLYILRWKTLLNVEIPPKCIICVAPHTSNWDFFYGYLYYMSIGGRAHFLMKKEWFFFPLGYILKALGGIPVNRKKKKSITKQMVKVISRKKNFQLAISPEGTRKRNSEWKTGFYYIALNASIPIVLAYIDYKLREVGIFRNFIPTGDESGDIAQIKSYYKNVTGKYPENFEI